MTEPIPRVRPNIFREAIQMALLIITPTMKPDPWVREFRRLAPDVDLRVWPDLKDPSGIRLAFTWKAPMGVFRQFKNLGCIASLGAGVDHILMDPNLPGGVPVTRVVDPSLAQYMREYVAMAVLAHCRHWSFFDRCRSEVVWRPKLPRLAEMTHVGVMGMGQLGKAVAQTLSFLGFQVTGWRRTSKIETEFRVFNGDAGLKNFLPTAEILVCLLPLTQETRNILNYRTFSALPQGAYIINVARGEHLVEEDLLAAIDSGHLSGACLDVFRTEPLPPEHPFWRHDRIVVTPHVSSNTNPRKVAPIVMENYRRLTSGEPLLHQVDPVKGY